MLWFDVSKTNNDKLTNNQDRNRTIYKFKKNLLNKTRNEIKLSRI